MEKILNALVNIKCSGIFANDKPSSANEKQSIKIVSVSKLYLVVYLDFVF